MIRKDTNTNPNPVLPGFYPDPSICRVENDYYLVTSTFAYFPGVPIFHSTDLIHWEQIGNILDREEQLPLYGAETSQGIFAPTLRYHDGIFYMITTNVTPCPENRTGNFIVTATDPAGPWSDPYPLGSAGIDPSLFFDDDGKCYYCGTKERREGPKYYGDNEIYIQELDLHSMKLTGESYPAWHGALKDVEWPEGPHIYKKDGWYYLLISEAGTAHNHAVSIARSKSLTEPFEGHRGNPILTHRHLGYNYPIVNVGHPDIVETQNGEWWMVCLASRTRGGYYRNLGRETYLVPFDWENGWPVVNPGKGIVESTVETPDLPVSIPAPVPEKEDFDTAKLPLHFLFLRNPIMENYSSARPGYMRLRLAKDSISSMGTPSYLCRRQLDFDFTAETSLSFTPQSENEQAGLVLYQSQSCNYQLLAGKKEGKTLLTLIKTFQDKKETLAETILHALIPDLILQITQKDQDLTFSYKTGDSSPSTTLARNIDARILSTDMAGGFVGNTVGIYATSNGEESENFADFDYLLYR